MTIDIRPIESNQIEDFHALVDSVARERRYLAFLEAPPIESTREYVGRMIAHGLPQFLAWDGGRAVGWCDVVRMSRPVQAHAGILGMGLLPDYRGKGYGRALIERTLKAAWDCGLIRVELDVYADNEPAIALYESVGFEREGLLRKSVLIDGDYKDSVAMAIIREP